MTNLTNLDLTIVAGIAIALIPPIICIIKAARNRLDLSPAGRIKLTRRYLKQCQAHNSGNRLTGSPANGDITRILQTA